MLSVEDQKLFKHNKLTVYMVYKMIEHHKKVQPISKNNHPIKQQKAFSNQIFVGNQLSQFSDNDIQFSRNSTVQLGAKQQPQQLRKYVEEQLLNEVENNECQHEDQKDLQKFKRQYRIKKCKTLDPANTSTFNSFIIQYMKKYVHKIQKSKVKTQQSEDYAGQNFGLNIQPVKRFQIVKSFKNKSRKSIFQNCRNKYTKLSIQKEDFIEKQDQFKLQKKHHSLSICQSIQLNEGNLFDYSAKSTQKNRFFTSIEKKVKTIDKIQKDLDQMEGKKRNNFLTTTKMNKKEERIEEKWKILGHKSNSVEEKVRRMRNCLDKVLNSFNCFLSDEKQELLNNKSLMMYETNSLNSTKMNSFNDSFKDTLTNLRQNNDKINPHSITKSFKSPKFTYFIGSGNNKNLIRSILKKRSWWTEVFDMKDAQLVWTQLKVVQLIEANSKSEPLVKIKENRNDSGTLNTKIVQKIKSKIDQKTKSKVVFNKKSSIAQFKQEDLLKLFHPSQTKRYSLNLTNNDLNQYFCKINRPSILHNHFSENYHLGNKNALYENLKSYYQFMNQQLQNIIPLTFYLDGEDEKSVNQFEQYYEEHKKNIWIVKPAENSNRGCGIFLTMELSEIKMKLQTEKKIIVQQYIKTNMLYNGRKFDIRVYLLIIRINGRTKYFFYEEGYIRTSSQLYDLTNLEDKFVHLTNDAIQSCGQNYGKYEKGNKVSYLDFQRYLTNSFPKEHYNVQQLHLQMKNIALDTIKAVYSRVDTKQNGVFELFGLDFLIDKAFKPYLLEVNTNPCLELSAPCLQRLIPRMIENMFRLAVDSLFRPTSTVSKSQSYFLYDQMFLCRNKFSLIFDEQFDRIQEWEDRCRSMNHLKWVNTVEETFENDGDLINIDY